MVFNMFSFVYKDVDFSHKLDLIPVKGKDYSKHAHHFNEVLFFVSGDLNYTVENVTHKLEPGDIVFISTGKFHFLDFNSEATYERYVFKFPDTAIPASLSNKLKKMPVFISGNKYISENVRNFDLYAVEKDKETAFMLFMCELSRLLLLSSNCDCNLSTTKTEANNFIQQIIAYIDHHIYEDITLEDISKDLNFSKSHLCNQFKHYMKISLIDYVRHKKMFVAESMVKSGIKKSVVAQQLGFSDYSTFYRQYKKITSEKK